MILEHLIPPSQQGRRWQAQLEGGEVLRLPESTVADMALYQGMELDEETLEDLKTAAFEGELRDRAVSILTSRLLSAAQLREKLCDKGATDQQAEAVAQWAERIGLLNDEAYAKSLVRHYQQRGYGLYKIKDELYRRKVPREYWEDALAELDNTAEQIDRFLEKKLPDPSDRKQVKKASDALVRRGFSWSEVSAGIRRRRDAFDALGDDDMDWSE